MRRAARLLVLAVLPALLLTGLLSGCGGDNTPDGTKASPNGQVKALTAKIEKGAVTPNAEKLEVKAGTTIKITVTADMKDELHVHGYDKSVELQPGKPATLEFVADTTGEFEIESHGTDKLIYQLVVQP
ncbi:cupredoxin domain-containing protein [Flindersiella endophytica]